jgi:hydrophobic/amphiphilic exporter-1 (mainly G- bacteria), HAE1 family
VQADPADRIEYVCDGGGRGGAMNAGRIFMTLKPRSARDGVQKVIDRLRVSTAKVQGMSSFFQPVQNINIGGRASKSMYQYTLQAGSLQDLYKWSDTLMKGLRQKKGFTDVTSDLEVRSLQAMVTIDQEKAASFGLSNETIRRALYDAFGSVQAASLYTASNDYAVVMEVSERFRQSPEDIGKIYLRGSGDRLVPLEAIGNVMRTLGPLSVNHQGQMAAVTLSFNLEEGFSLGEAVKVIAATRGEVKMPDNITGSFQGSAQVFQESAQGQGMLIVMTVLVIYIILGMLYESFIHPITILSGLPSAGIGAVISLMLFGMDLSVIAIVGVIMLIGIVKKNAIMMIDFAVEARAQGKSAEEAIYQACLMRFRPIMMTTMAAIFGTLPIAIGVGAGAELRQPLGVSIVGGLLASQMLTLYITPVIYMYLEKLANWRRKDPDSDYSSVTSI